MNTKGRYRLGGVKSKQFGEGALEEEDHGIIKAKLEGSLARASIGVGPHTTIAGRPFATLTALWVVSTFLLLCQHNP